MKVGERIKRLFRRKPPTAEEPAARAEAERMREQLHQDEAVMQNQGAGRLPGSGGPP